MTMTSTTLDLKGSFTLTSIAAITASASLLLLIAPILNLLYQLNFPKILTFPWPPSSSKSKTKQNDKETTVVFAGSFNPPHNGHLVMIQYLAMRYKQVIVVIGVNPNKKYDVLPQTRADILKKMVDTLELGKDCNVRVEGKDFYLFVTILLMNE
jgi:cytidyltransferase-like protein